MNANLPLEIYFDASCPLCRNEMDTIKLHDTQGDLILIDCSAPGFDDSSFKADGVEVAHMLDALHIRDSQGVWFKGVSAFELVYEAIGLTTVAKFWGGNFTKPFAERIYPMIAKNRQLLTWTGIPLLFKLWGKSIARRAHKRSQQCNDGHCSIHSSE